MLVALTACATTADRQATAGANAKAGAQLDAQIESARLNCDGADQCAKLWDAAQQWAALRPHRLMFRVKEHLIRVGFMDGSEGINAEFVLEKPTGATAYLKIDVSCADYGLVVLPLSCGLESKQITVQAEEEIGKML
jgi:hypothetical protein